MVQQLALPEDEMERKAKAIRLLSLGFLVAAIIAELVFITLRLSLSDLQFIQIR